MANTCLPATPAAGTTYKAESNASQITIAQVGHFIEAVLNLGYRYLAEGSGLILGPISDSRTFTCILTDGPKTQYVSARYPQGEPLPLLAHRVCQRFHWAQSMCLADC